MADGPVGAGLRHSIKEPIPEILAVVELLDRAADAIISGDHAEAARLLAASNSPIVWAWVNPAWDTPEINIVDQRPERDTHVVPKSARDGSRDPTSETERAVLTRDGYRCRYCGIPVISADIRRRLHHLYPGAVPWNPRDNAEQHAGLQCLWLQFDHVVPHSHGGSSGPDNVVVTCALCNYGKYHYTLAQLGLSDPRDRPPVPIDWDGLERLRCIPLPSRRPAGTKPSSRREAIALGEAVHSKPDAEAPADRRLLPAAAANGEQRAAFVSSALWPSVVLDDHPPVGTKAIAELGSQPSPRLNTVEAVAGRDKRREDPARPAHRPDDVVEVFLPGARIKGDYLYTPLIAGKERWFDLRKGVSAEPVIVGGVKGCSLRCKRGDLARRGIYPDEYGSS